MSTHQHTDKSSKDTSTRAKESRHLFGAHPAQILQRLESAPGSIRPADILQLQRCIGNRARDGENITTLRPACVA